MLKNKVWLGIILSIILLVSSINGFTAFYKYTQESGTSFFVASPDKSDALEDTNEVRQIIDDLGNLLVHSKRNDLYPKDETTGGTLAIPNSALVSFATGTKGDLFYCSAANTWIKLNIGSDNQILVVATDLPNWETPSSDLLSDVALIAMLDENEAITGAWTVTGSIGGVDTTEFGYLADISAFGGSIIDDADEATFKATVNLEIGTDVLAEQTIGIADDNLVEIDDADAAVDDYCKLTANGVVGRSYAEVKTDLSLNLVANLKVKLDATGAPTVNNDVDEGYTVGSRWLDITNDKEYVCLDNTDGAAVWTETTGAGGGSTAWDDIGNPDAADEIDFGAHIIELNVEDFRIGDGGDNYIKFADAGVLTLEGTANIEGVDATEFGYLNGVTSDIQTQFGLRYLKTEMDEFSELQAIISDKTLVNTLSKVNVFASITEAELYGILSDVALFLEDLVDDTTPELGGTLDHNNERDTEVKTIEFNGLYDCGNSGATPTINWQNGNYQKIAISENALLTFSNAFIGTITLVMTYSGNYTLGFNAGYTILEEGGAELSFTETSAAVDILKIMYLGTASNYVVGVMLDVKD